MKTKKFWSLMLAISLALSLILTGCGSGGTAGKTDAGKAEETVAEEQVEAALFAEVEGTYDELFTVICEPAYDSLWIEDCAAIVGEEQAQETADALKAACTGTIYGDEAVAAYVDGSGGMQFDCYFINGVRQFIFAGNEIAGLDENGQEIFRHTYQDAGSFSIGGMMDGELYETKDADAGEFRYFVLLPDTPATTWHTEFRYGSSREDLEKYNEGAYAYWLAAGIPADRDEEMVKNVIRLFCEENLAEE